MSKKNDDSLSFVDDSKESVYGRIRMLMGKRSVRDCAKLWNVPHSTLASALNRKSDPKLSMLLSITEAEGVTLEWLSTGKELEKKQATPKPQEDNVEPSADGMLLSLLTQEERHKLCRRIITKGVNSLDISERDDRLLALVADMNDEHFKEIYAFVHKAKYMLLAGLPIGKPADVDSWDEKRA